MQKAIETVQTSSHDPRVAKESLGRGGNPEVNNNIQALLDPPQMLLNDQQKSK